MSQKPPLYNGAVFFISDAGLNFVRYMIKYFKQVVCLFLSAGFFHYAAAQSETRPYVMVLGIAQDGGYPHLGCEKKCCQMAWQNDSLKKSVVCLALVNPLQKKWWMFEATPDIKSQLHYFRN